MDLRSSAYEAPGTVAPYGVAGMDSSFLGVVLTYHLGNDAVQIAAYNTAAEAEALVRRLRARNVTARVSGTVKPFRVRTGNHATRAEANAALRELRARGIHGFVVDESATASP